MSFIHVPDPFPGRCQNVRHVLHANGEPETLRCLDYEGTRHVCEFPPSRVNASSTGWVTYQSIMTAPPAPKRWVKP